MTGEPTKMDAENLEGMENTLIRYYFYLNNGLNILNNFRNLFLGIIGLYLALKLDNWWLLLAMFVPSILILMIAGYYLVHRMNKRIEWLTTRFGTTYVLQQFNFQEGIHETLKEIKEKL